ncbi:hypothetical protein KCU81_g6309, partial [Aureobasidium melanogenum]|uniref:BTB domain-containing protein n=1 Tax=Aureobasidium melanogenum (strain CBS 110374) TaxID=1043003 RepID=A0A074W9S2_AURM1
MSEGHFINGDHLDSTVFNDPRDSDIILTFGNHQVYAHRVILRMWSPFFQRSLNSQFSVSNSATFIIDDECDGKHEPEAVFAMLKHIYGMPFGSGSNCRPDGTSVIEYSIKVYKLADKYDILSVRRAAVEFIESYINAYLYLSKTQNPPASSPIPDCIAHICGPDAPQLADLQLRNALFSWLSKNICALSKHNEFKVKIEDGSLLDVDLTAKLLFRLTEEIDNFAKW